MKILDLLTAGKKLLKEENIDEREARLLLAFALGIKSDDLGKYFEVDDSTGEKYNKIIIKRKNHVPYSYITGNKEFMKLNFKVNENVLIPRADTEILVEEAINICKEFGDRQISVLDMCTGSGCIAVSLAKYVENAKVIASDVSEEALQVARENAISNNVFVDFIKSNLFENINDRFDVIVSNPPYIKKAVIDTLDKEVKDNEPMLALDGGEDGLRFYRAISNEAKEYLYENGYLIFEIGYDQAKEVEEILNQEGYKNIRVIKDYSGNDRVVVANI